MYREELELFLLFEFTTRHIGVKVTVIIAPILFCFLLAPCSFLAKPEVSRTTCELAIVLEVV
jgi:hypothetical protein